MRTIKEILNKSSVFSALGKEDIQQLEVLFEKWDIFPGDIPATAGDAAQFFFLLHDGTVLLALEDGKSIVLNVPGDFIGLELLSERGTYKTTLTVLEKGSLFVVPRQDFLAFIRENSAVAALILPAWQEYLEKTASFVEKTDDTSLLEYF